MPKPVYAKSRLLLGDCLELLPTLPAESVEAIVTDPPYGLSFMGRAWDHGVPGIPFWVEALRVAKPGTHLLAFGGTRTFHRLACAIEDAGWEIRDTIMWVYGSGFPKSLDVSKAIDKAAGAERAVVGRKAIAYPDSDVWGVPNRSRTEGQGVGSGEVYGKPGEGYVKENGMGTVLTAPATDAAQRWQGWGTALKPAWEPILVARKPLAGTVAANVQRHGTGALNIDGCRVETSESLNGGAYAANGADRESYQDWRFKRRGDAGEYQQPSGRWPANLIHDGSEEVLNEFEKYKTAEPCGSVKKTNGSGGLYQMGSAGAPGVIYRDSGSAARFFYAAKASKADRTEKGAVTNKHPTVKPVSLMRYLVRLVTPPDGLVLDPFCGSGSTGKAARLEGFRFLGIDSDEESLETARQRLAIAEKALQARS